MDRPEEVLRARGGRGLRSTLRRDGGATLSAPRAIVLAAGLGTRLGGLSSLRPKPMFPVAGYALLRYAIELLRRHGTTEIVINLHHRGDVIRAELGDGRALGVELSYSEEPEILGTGGGLVRVRDFLTRGGREPFWVVNGKILIDVDLGAMRAAHERADAVATMALRPLSDADAQKWGAIYVCGPQVDEPRVDEPRAPARVVGILERGTHTEARACMFTGVHFVTPRLVARLPSSGVSDSIRQGYVPALAGGEPIAAWLVDGYFHEHSTPRRYLDGNWKVLDGKAARVPLPGPTSGIDDGAQIAPSATIVTPVRVSAGAIVEAGATVGPYAVVCPDAIVASGAALDHVVVWPGARADGALSNAIVTAAGVFSGDAMADARDE